MGSLTLHELLATLRAHGVREVVLRLDPAGPELEAPPAPPAPMVLAPPAARPVPAPEAPAAAQGEDGDDVDEGEGDGDPLFWATELRPRKRKGPEDEG